jgi:hypothetical protein
MKKYLTALLPIVVVACKNEPLPRDCEVTLTGYQLNTIAAAPCSPTGSISISKPGRYRYKINNRAFQDSGIFRNLIPGSYVVTLQPENGCVETDTIVLPTISAGPQFLAVQQLLVGQCQPCHIGVNPQAGLEWNRACDILQHADRIRARAIEGNPTPMPPTGLLPVSQRNLILNWINTGARYDQ